MKKMWMTGLAAVMSMTACGPGSPDDTKPPAQSKAIEYSPQDLYRGLYFGTGPVAAKLPQIWAKGNPGAPKSDSSQSNQELAKSLTAETAALTKAGLSPRAQANMKEAADALAHNPTTPAQRNAELAALAENGEAPNRDADVTKALELIAKADPTFLARFAKEIRSGDPVTVSNAVQEGTVVLQNALALQGDAVGALARGDFEQGLGVQKNIWHNSNILLVKEVAVAITTAGVLYKVAAAVIATFANSEDPLQHEAWMKIIAADLAT